MSKETRLKNFQRASFPGLNAKMGTLHFPTNLPLIFASTMDAIHSLSFQTVHWPDSMPLGRGWGQPLEPNAGQGKQIQFIGNSQPQIQAHSDPQ